MTLRVTAALSSDRTVWPGLPRCTIELVNGGDAPIRWLNDRAARYQCGLQLTRPDTGETLRWDPEPSQFVDPPERRLDAGSTVREVVSLASRGALPGPGRWELRVRARHAEGEVVSDPVAFDVIAAPITGFDLVNAAGRPDGHALCAWVATAQQGAVVGLSTLSTTYTPRFVDSSIACSATAGVWPVLSVAPRRSARHPHFAWLDMEGLHWVLVEPSAYGIGSMPCEPGWQLVSPMVEDDRGAAAVLVRSGEGSWQLRTVRLDTATLSAPQTVAGPPPQWGKLAVFSDGRADLLTLHPDASGLELLRASWAASGQLASPQHAATVRGRLLAADVRAILGDASAGVILCAIEGTPPRVVAHRFAIAGPGAPLRVEPLREVELPAGDVVAQALAAVDEAGRVHALLRVGGAGGARWVWWAEERGLLELPEAIAGTATPRALTFLHGTRPALVWIDPRAGLRVHPVDPPLVPVPVG